MVNLKLSGLLDEGRIVQEQLIKILQRHEDALGDSSSADTSQGNRITALETAVGKASGDGAGGIAKDVADINTAIGDETTEGTILARIKALEDAQ
jgi:hypothetical protein